MMRQRTSVDGRTAVLKRRLEEEADAEMWRLRARIVEMDQRTPRERQLNVEGDGEDGEGMPREKGASIDPVGGGSVLWCK